jgi:hypothetical protein
VQVGEILSDMTDATSFRQLMLDLDIMRDAKGTGGDNLYQKWLRENHPGRIGTNFKDLPRDIRKQYDAFMTATLVRSPKPERAQILEGWQKHSLWLYENAVKVPTYGHLDAAENERIRMLLWDVYNRMKREEPKRIARKPVSRGKGGSR